MPLPDKLVEVEISPGWWLSSERALYLATERMLVIADIHWGYAHSHRQIGNLLPMWGNEETARRLNSLIEHYRPEQMIWLGDSLHTSVGATYAEEFLDKLSSLEVVIIAGNHDRKWPRADRKEYQVGPWFFHHGDHPREITEGLTEVIGHIHPAISWSDGAGLRLKIPALVQRHNRLILPSFSAWSAGATWNDQLAEDEKVWLVSSRRIWSMTHGQLRRS